MVDVVDPRELQQHDGVVVEKEEEEVEAPRAKTLGEDLDLD